ncbi:MAG: SpoIID/LytB domain-containing protein [Cyanobacteriota bacterium]|nr:SpoIID/LytB domain-containing protein [Cyanobacteriota bacterium]
MGLGLRLAQGRSLPRSFLIAPPLAVSAIGLGFASQTLWRPPVSAHQRDVLDALMAPPPASATRPAAGLAADTTASATQAATPTGALQARRLPASSAGGGQANASNLNLEIRVALLKLSPYPRVGGDGGWRVVSREGQVLRQGGAGEASQASDLLAERPEVWIEATGSAPLRADGRPYAGRLRLLRAADGIQVVNHLPLESYVSSVVGGEMPSSWRIEALRAQAVAARSYAMAHMARPADAHWHLGDTTRWQNYEGLNTVSDPTLTATRTTAGVILSYQGGIVESLYAATQQIVEEAHGHLGASMSQTGAQQLAEQGLPFQEILAHYYQGASLARLQIGAS